MRAILCYHANVYKDRYTIGLSRTVLVQYTSVTHMKTVCNNKVETRPKSQTIAALIPI